MAAQYITAFLLGGYAPAAGGYVYFYQPGTTVQITVYQDDAASQAITQPVQLDQNGRPATAVYALVPARAIVFSSTNAQLLDISRCNGIQATTSAVANSLWPGETTVDGVLTALGTSLGGTDGNFKAAGTGSVQRSVVTKLSESVSVKDFGAAGNGIADDTAPIVAAMTAVNAAGGGVVSFPVGTYVISSTLNMLSGVSLKGVNSGASIISYSGASNGITLTGSGRVLIEDLAVTSPGGSTAADSSVAPVGI